MKSLPTLSTARRAQIGTLFTPKNSQRYLPDTADIFEMVSEALECVVYNHVYDEARKDFEEYGDPFDSWYEEMERLNLRERSSEPEYMPSLWQWLQTEDSTIVAEILFVLEQESGTDCVQVLSCAMSEKAVMSEDATMSWVSRMLSATQHTAIPTDMVTAWLTHQIEFVEANHDAASCAKFCACLPKNLLLPAMQSNASVLQFYLTYSVTDILSDEQDTPMTAASFARTLKKAYETLEDSCQLDLFARYSFRLESEEFQEHAAYCGLVTPIRFFEEDNPQREQNLRTAFEILGAKFIRDLTDQDSLDIKARYWRYLAPQKLQN